MILCRCLVLGMLVGGIAGQSIADLLQRQNDNLLQQTMLRSLRNQVSFFGNGNNRRANPLTNPTSLINQLSSNVQRVTQNLMNSMTQGRAPALPRVQTRNSFADTAFGSNIEVIPVDQLLRQQQRGPPASLTVPEFPGLPGLPGKKQGQTVLVVPVNQWASRRSNGSPSVASPDIVVVERKKPPAVVAKQRTVVTKHSSAKSEPIEAQILFEAPGTGSLIVPGSNTKAIRTESTPSGQRVRAGVPVGGIVPTRLRGGSNKRLTSSSGTMSMDQHKAQHQQTRANAPLITPDILRPMIQDAIKSITPDIIRSLRPELIQSMNQPPYDPISQQQQQEQMQLQQQQSTQLQRQQTKQLQRQQQAEQIQRQQQQHIEQLQRQQQAETLQLQRQQQAEQLQRQKQAEQLQRQQATELAAQRVSQRSQSTVQTVPTGTTDFGRRPDLLYSKERITCSKDFQDIKGHTICMNDNPGLKRYGVSEADKVLITEYHNELRGSVEPPATDLMNLLWDERLASVAQKWANRCDFNHDKVRSVPDIGMAVGQNVGGGFLEWAPVIKAWYDEVKLYQYGKKPDSYLGPNGWRQVAHYTQMMQNGTYLLGCGYAFCPNTLYKHYFVCNYAKGQMDLATPYTAGTRCGRCPNNCVMGLCDCGGLVCHNNGQLDPATCTCKCKKPYAGRSCKKLDCPAQDNWSCGRDWTPDFCDKYVNVPEECPHMCGPCKGGAHQGNVTTFTSSFGCTYAGIRDDLKTCKAYGNKGQDKGVCASKGGKADCQGCEMYSNIKRDYCPIMCGLCDPQCGGKECLNYGKLNSDTCQCDCQAPFSGELCQNVNCNKPKDTWWCKFYGESLCQNYAAVRANCTIKCGFCPKPMAINNNNNKDGTPTAESPSGGGEAGEAP